jgi:hypothetical protein
VVVPPRPKVVAVAAVKPVLDGVIASFQRFEAGNPRARQAGKGRDTCFADIAILSSERRDTIEIIPQRKRVEKAPDFRNLGRMQQCGAGAETAAAAVERCSGAH